MAESLFSLIVGGVVSTLIAIPIMIMISAIGQVSPAVAPIANSGISAIEIFMAGMGLAAFITLIFIILKIFSDGFGQDGSSLVA